ncbi:hypothetical protein [Planctomonas deserti]|uniref:hypothetical protein n=1 Tax=Planctomonas deserti TaxID=2144185 RepID=UPI000D37AC08|nr:hypothetical protein [Planctomonas deserti]
MALFVTITGGVLMLLALVVAVVAFDRPGAWLPLLVIMQLPFWGGIWSLREQRRSKGSNSASEPGL